MVIQFTTSIPIITSNETCLILSNERSTGADQGFPGFSAVHMYKGLLGSLCLLNLFYLKYPMEMK